MAALNLYRYADVFKSKDIKGSDLLNLDRDKLVVRQSLIPPEFNYLSIEDEKTGNQFVSEIPPFLNVALFYFKITFPKKLPRVQFYTGKLRGFHYFFFLANATFPFSLGIKTLHNNRNNRRLRIAG